MLATTGERYKKEREREKHKHCSHLFENRRSMFSAISNVCVETPDYPICGNINISVEVRKKSTNHYVVRSKRLWKRRMVI